MEGVEIWLFCYKNLVFIFNHSFATASPILVTFDNFHLRSGIFSTQCGSLARSNLNGIYPNIADMKAISLRILELVLDFT